MEALLCELRQLIHSKGTRAEFRLLVDEKIAPEYRRLAAVLKRAEEERDEKHGELVIAILDMNKLTSRLEQAVGVLESGSKNDRFTTEVFRFNVQVFLSGVAAKGEKRPETPEGSPR